VQGLIQGLEDEVGSIRLIALNSLQSNCKNEGVSPTLNNLSPKMQHDLNSLAEITDRLANLCE